MTDISAIQEPYATAATIREILDKTPKDQWPKKKEWTDEELEMIPESEKHGIPGELLQYFDTPYWVPQSKSFLDIEEKPINWLWKYWIPRGMITVLEGPPGVGKSTIALDLMARLSNGMPMPFSDQKPNEKFIRSAIIQPEDPVDSVVKPRLRAAGATLWAVHHYERLVKTESRVQKKSRFKLTPEHLQKLEEFLNGGDFQLCYFDAVMGLLNSKDANSDQDTREILEPLAQLAERTNCAILVGRHWAKGASNRASHERGIGSIAWTGVARSVLQVGRNPKDPETRIIALGKQNLAPDQPGRTFRLAPVELELNRTNATFTKVEWLEEIDGFDAASIGRETKEDSENASDKAEVYLLELLTNSPEIQANQLKDKAIAYGLGKTAIEQAKSKMKADGKIRYIKKADGWWVVLTGDNRPMPTADEVFPSNDEMVF